MPQRSLSTFFFSLAVAALAATACQGMDRLEPDRVTDVGAAERGTVLDGESAPGFGGGGPLTEEIALRRIRQIEVAEPEERLRLAQRFVQEYPGGRGFPGAESISVLHELVGDAHSDLGDPKSAAESWERAIALSWPAPDLLELPQTNLELPYRVGWARIEAGEPEAGAEWLTRATVISSRPQLLQGLQFLFAEMGSPGAGFNDWLAGQRDRHAVAAPDFELPGFGFESLRLSEVEGQLTLINFWTPT